MTKTELEKAIKNGESVWINGNEHKLNKYYFVAEYNNEPTLYLMTCGYEEDDWDNYPVEKITNIYRTKVEAEHYLHHSNVVRTEELPFLTWEEFLKEKRFEFTDVFGKKRTLIIYGNKILLEEDGVFWYRPLLKDGGKWYIFMETLTEENFYKAYDECVKLFRGE